MGICKMNIDKRDFTQKDFDRYMSCVDKESSENGCWLWIGRINKKGYGEFTIRKYLKKILDIKGSRTALTHKLMWYFKTGIIPKGYKKIVCHSCNVPNCVNPDHIRLDTAASNMADALKLGTHPNLHRFGSNNPCSKLKEENIPVIDYLRLLGLTNKQIAKKFNVADTTISKAYRRISWKHIPKLSSGEKLVQL